MSFARPVLPAPVPDSAIRDATLADLDAVMALEHACYDEGVAFERDTYESYLNWDRAVNLVVDAPDGKGLVAFGGGIVFEEERLAEVYTLNVHPDARGRQLGRRMLEALEHRFAVRRCERVFLEVNVANAPAIRLYEAAGYARTERLEGYYEDTSYPEKDAYRYLKDL